MRNEIFTMFRDYIEDMGIGVKYVINGFIGAIIWSLYKRLKFVESLRQITIGAVVAGYVTPLIGHLYTLPPEFNSALSFIVGMMGLVIIDTFYKYIRNLYKTWKAGKDARKLAELLKTQNEEDGI